MLSLSLSPFNILSHPHTELILSCCLLCFLIYNFIISPTYLLLSTQRCALPYITNPHTTNDPDAGLYTYRHPIVPLPLQL